MARTVAHPGGQLLARPDEVHEPQARHGVPEQVAVGAAQRRARDDRTVGERGELPADGTQPGPPVGVVERGAVGHLREVLRRVEAVGVEERDAEPVGEQRADGRLAAAGHPHDDDVGHQSCTVPSASRLYGRYATS
ncbi:hypothetical protein ASF78_02260 [Cellulomonas sp. Leaf334]|nr:hypothetical protein ASF78_02260 [Cellulomonas sp. Leaf334]